MAYTWDDNKYRKIGEQLGFYDSPSSYRSYGTLPEPDWTVTPEKIQQWKQMALEQAKQEQLKREQEKEQLKKLAASMNLTQKDLEEKSNPAGTKYSQDVANLKARLEAAGVNPSEVVDDRNWFEKWANLKKDQGFIMDTLELLNRPGNAIRSAIKEGANDLSNWMSGKSDPKDNTDFIDAALQGLKGQRETSGSDVLETLTGWQKSKDDPNSWLDEINNFARGVVGFGTDIITDPLTLIPIGGVLEKVGKTAADSKILKALTNSDAYKNISRKVDSIFGTGGKKYDLEGNIDPFLVNLERETMKTDNYMKQKIIDNTARNIQRSGGFEKGNAVQDFIEKDHLRAINKDLEKAIKEGKLPEGMTEAEARQTIERNQGLINDAWSKVIQDPVLKETADRIMQQNDDIRKLAIETGINVDDLAGYITHVAKLEHLDEAGKLMGDGLNYGKYVTGGGNVKTIANRKYIGSAKSINQDLGKDLFHENAFVSSAVGQQRLTNLILNENAKRQLLNNPKFARPYKPGDIKPPGTEVIDAGDYKLFWDEKKLGPLPDDLKYEGKYLVTSGAKQFLDNLNEKLTDEGIANFDKGLRGINKIFKSSATLSAGYHVRNILGAAWNQYLAGMNPKEMVKFNTDALQTINKVDKLAKMDRNYLTASEKKMVDEYDEFMQQGLKNTGYSHEVNLSRVRTDNDLIQAVQEGTKSFTDKVKSKVADGEGIKGKAKGVLEANRLIGDKADEVMKFGLYKFYRSKGFDPKTAGEKVREVLFDHTRLTQAEQKIASQVMPFYTWTKNNAIYQLKSFAKDPRKFHRLNMAVNEGYENSNIDPEMVPKYQKDAFAIPVKLPFLGDTLFNPQLPAGDINKYTQLDELSKVPVEGMNPLIRLGLIEAPTNSNMFLSDSNGKPVPLENFPGEQKNYLGANVDGTTKQLLDSFTPLRNMNKAWQGSGGLDSLLKLFGLDMAKPQDIQKLRENYDRETMQNLDNAIKQQEQAGKTIPKTEDIRKDTLMNEQGPVLKALEKRYGEARARILLQLQREIARRNNPEFTKQAIEQMYQSGIDTDVIKYVIGQ